MVEELLGATYLGNAAWRWSTAVGIAAGTFIVLLLLRRLIKSRYARLAATPQDEIMEVPLDNLGIEIQPLLAGLGIGGIAVALAAQTSSATCSHRSRSRSTGRS